MKRAMKIHALFENINNNVRCLHRNVNTWLLCETDNISLELHVILFLINQFNSIHFNSIQFNSIQFNSIQFNSIQFNSIQFNSIQFNIGMVIYLRRFDLVCYMGSTMTTVDDRPVVFVRVHVLQYLLFKVYYKRVVGMLKRTETFMLRPVRR